MIPISLTLVSELLVVTHNDVVWHVQVLHELAATVPGAQPGHQHLQSHWSHCTQHCGGQCLRLPAAHDHHHAGRLCAPQGPDSGLVDLGLLGRSAYPQPHPPLPHPPACDPSSVFGPLPAYNSTCLPALPCPALPPCLPVCWPIGLLVCPGSWCKPLVWKPLAKPWFHAVTCCCRPPAVWHASFAHQ